MKTVGIVTIHGVYNFGSLLQSYATLVIVKRLGYSPEIINYRYPNEYHLSEYRKHSPYANLNLSFGLRVRLAVYHRTIGKRNQRRKISLYKEARRSLLYQTIEYPTQKALQSAPPKFDIYLTGSDQVWNPRYMYADCTYLLNFVHNVPKVAYSASFGTTELPDEYKALYYPLLKEYSSISVRELSGVKILQEISGKSVACTCDPTLLLTGDEWKLIFDDKPIVRDEYILCYILTYSANCYPYASNFMNYMRKHLKKKVVILDESGRYWMDPRYKSFQTYGPREIINLFQNASFIISSSFHGAAFSINLKKDFYSLFPKGVMDERQESLLKIVGAEDRFIQVGDPFPDPSSFKIQNWDEITKRLNMFRNESIDYLSNALKNATNITK